MNTEQILKLIDAGYTKSEIDAMAAEKSESAVSVDEPKELSAEPEQNEAQNEAPVVDDKTEKRLEKIENILSQIAAKGIANSAAPEPSAKRDVVKEVLEHL